MWLFKCWLERMNGQAPKAIMTDQDKAMKNANVIVFPESRHRYCIWHIMKKFFEKFGSYVCMTLKHVKNMKKNWKDYWRGIIFTIMHG
jgi:hypothetical protein